MNTDELKALSEKIASDPQAVYDMSPEELSEMQKYLNPLGNIVSENKSYINLSIVNWTEKYIRKLTTTALIGYIYRLQMEYLPEDEIEASRLRMEAKLKTCSEPQEIADVRAEHDRETKLLTRTARSMVKKFLDRNFNYNPDHHLRAAHSENAADPERVSRAEGIKRACRTAEKATGIETKLESKPDMTYKWMRNGILQSYQTAVEVTDVTKRILGTILDPELSNSDKQGILLKRYKQMVEITNDMKKIAEPIAAADTLSAWKVDPPADAFHQFDRYLTNHYEQIREVCAALYNEKPDMEFAVIFYKSFETEEAAAQHRNQHESNFRAEVLTIENSGVTLIGPFKENRERVLFYNKNIEIMKRMMEQVETDHKLGKDLMVKTVGKQKKKNIKEVGPDSAGLKDYSRAMNQMAADGAKKILSKDDEDALAKEAAEREDRMVPENAIQIDMFYPQTGLDGETTLSKKKFYSQAEAPLHLQEGSEFHGQYQPVRADTLSVTEAYDTKTVISKTGEKKSVKVLAADARNGKDKEEEK
jgi:hypothetical protein